MTRQLENEVAIVTGAAPASASAKQSVASSHATERVVVVANSVTGMVSVCTSKNGLPRSAGHFR